MLRRLDNDARAIIELANTIAHEYELEYVGTEHILLAILRHNQGAGARALQQLGLDEARVRAQIDDLARRDMEDTWVFGRLPGTPHYRDVIERAQRLTDQLEGQQIGSAHLLLALYHDQECSAQRALAALGLTPETCRAAVLEQLAAD